MKRPYLLTKRGNYWYYRLADQKTFHSTGQTSRGRAEAWVLNAYSPIPELKPLQNNAEGPLPSDLILREYLVPFFLWDRCPHVTRLREEGKAISEGYVKKQRRRMETYLCTDGIVNLKIGSIRRADILDFRRRLIEKDVGTRTINMTIGILKIVLHEALFREDIDRDPTLGIGQLKYEQQEVGVFSRKEMIALFAECPGVWRNLQVYTAFLLAAHCGLRRSETLALVWGQLDLEIGVVFVDRAMTDNDLPKWNKKRKTLMTSKCIDALKELRRSSSWVLPDQFVFCSANGAPRKFTWWKKNFEAAMIQANLMSREDGHLVNPRNLRPHSFRHSLNTLLRDEGADPAKLREMFGWSNEAVQDGYTHWQVEHFEAQRSKIEDLLE